MRRRPDETIEWRTSIAFVVFHFVPLLAVFTGVTARAVIFGVVAYFIRVFAITGGYHRYFAHRSYRLARVPQFLLAFLGTTTVQQGPLWWAAHHRDHHRFSDTERDPHTPRKGFWYAHIGWILAPANKGTGSNIDRIKDFARYPELRFLDRFHMLGPILLGVLAYLVAGWSGVVIGFFASTIVLWHATFLINSAAHLVGRRRHATTDTSRNSWLLAVITLGEGWHNDHHHYQSACRQSDRWWQWDPTYQIVRAFGWLGIARDIRRRPAWAKENKRIDLGALDIGMIAARMDQVGDLVADSAVTAPEAEAVRAELIRLGDVVDQASASVPSTSAATRRAATAAGTPA